ncbi:Retrovirus-related Pol polyprotein from transposon TNT 1-94 [Vitis vinifera]|uniref:Retrovirus-related Pol polyprotein from transposon TNT 1-94 n=1 Tax=Vitis vinifera TaxID=29760 RepID=A0A438FNP0_VITVI|nr:Retrovirus-related Pol polyprotein from transposon TNT 1-94 [Vitis vinifera]
MEQPEGCVVPGKEKSLEVVCENKKFLGSKFDMKDLGGVEILRKFEHYDCKPMSTSYARSSQLKKNREHSVAQIEVLKYLRGTINYGLCYSGFPSILKGFSHANWISDSDEMKSTSSGYVFTLGGSTVSWKSAKQACITWSTMKAKFITLEKASSKAEWLRNLLVDITLCDETSPVCVYAL